MLTRKEIEQYFEEINEHLEATKNIDAIFEPTKELRNIYGQKT